MGLIWLDALFGPNPVHGADIVNAGLTPGGNEILLPVVRADSIGLARLRFDAADGTGLFGNKEELLADWQLRLGLAPQQAAETAPETAVADPE